MHDPTPLWDLLDRALGWFAEPERSARLIAAQAVFMRRTGEFEPGQPWFEERVRMFHDGFLLDHVEDDVVPLAEFVLAHHETLGAAQRDLYVDLLRSGHRSLFEVRRRTDAALVLRDVLGGPTYEVAPEREFVGLAPFDLLDARLLRTGEVVFLGRGLLVHPRPAREAIHALVARRTPENGEAPLDLPDVLAHMKLAYDRAENPRIPAIYHPDSYLFRRLEAAAPHDPDG